MSMAQQPGYPPPPQSSNRGCFGSCGCGCILLVLLCCGGLVGVAIWAGMSLKDSVVNDPVAAAEVGNRIATFDVPEGLEPTTAIDFKLPGLGPIVEGAVFMDKEQKTMLLLFQLKLQIEGMNQEDILNNMRTQVQSGQSNQQQDSILVDAKEVMVKIRGNEEKVKLNKRRPKSSAPGKDEVWDVTAPFQGKGGPSLVVFTAPADEWTEADIIELLESFE